MKRILFILGLVLLPLSFASAGTEHNVTGWAWSSNVGWISFNCTNISVASCSGVNYGLTIEASNALTGFAWSPHVGWIQFGGLSGFPSGAGTYTGNAEKNGSSLRGWARALSNGDGWDGWISLGGTNHTIVASSSGAFLGYGWGSNVVGWVSFDGAGSDGVRLGGGANLVAKSSGVPLSNGAVIPHNSNVELVYELINMPVGQTCSLSKTSSYGTFSTVSGIATSGSAFTGILGTNGSATTTYEYQLLCTNGQTMLVSFNVQPELPGFSLIGPTSVKIPLAVQGTTTSPDMNFNVTYIGGYSGNVNISVSPLSPALDASTTAAFFIGNSSETNRTYTLPLSTNLTIYGADAGFTLQLRTSKPLTEPKTFIVTATSGSIVKNITVTVDSTIADPRYQEF
jgi:hypothetical protein